VEEQRDLWLSKNPAIKILRVHPPKREPQSWLTRLGVRNVPRVSITVDYEDPDIITEYVRQRMARSILKPYLVDGVLNIMMLEKPLEEKVIAGFQNSDQGGFLPLDLAFGQKLVEKIAEETRKTMLKSLQPILLVHPIIRGKLRKFLERHLQGIAVISHNEIPPQIKIQSVGIVKMNEQ